MSELDQEDRGARLSADAQSIIGRKLKAMYDEVVKEPVPDRFLDLLARLDGGSPGAGSIGGASGEAAGAADEAVSTTFSARGAVDGASSAQASMLAESRDGER
jgi:hypothetical protein